MKLTEAFAALGYEGPPLTPRQWSAPDSTGTEIVTLWKDNIHYRNVGIIDLTVVASERLPVGSTVKVAVITARDMRAEPRVIVGAMPHPFTWKIVHKGARPDGRPFAVIAVAS